MTDTELDELLDRWKTPPMRESARDDVRVQFARATRRPERFAVARTIVRRMVVGGACAAALLFAIVQISPRTVRMASAGYHIPFYVDSVYESFNRDGSLALRSHQTWFPYAGYPITMSTVSSIYRIPEGIQEIGAAIRNRVVLAMPSLVLPKQPPMQEPDWHVAFVKSGCSQGRNVIGHEIIAGRETTVVQSGPPGPRLTIWLAPELGCYALKMTWEAQQPDGTYRLQSRSEAFKVTMNP